MDEYFVSVIVPIYNVDKYLRRCIDSVLNQSYSNYEVILIDDGSTDLCGDICDEYKNKFNNIKVIHQKNQGLSAARNTGIDNCSGDYLIFIDSDDYIEKHFIEYHVNVIKRYNADMVISGIETYYEGNEENNLEKKSKSEMLLPPGEVLKRMLMQKGIDVGAVAKVYSRKQFENIRYPVGKVYEDMLVVDKIIRNYNRIVVSDYVGYFYLQRQGSILHTKMDRKRMSLIDASFYLIDFCQENYPEVKNAAIYRFVINNFQILKISVREKKFQKESNVIRHNILKYKKYIFLSEEITLKMKVSTFLLLFGLLPYRLSRKVYERKNKEIL